MTAVRMSGRSGVMPAMLQEGTTLDWARLPPKAMRRSETRTP